MALIFTQTDTALTPSFSTQCQTAADGNAEANTVQNDATDGGTAGSTESSIGINKPKSVFLIELQA